MKQALTIEFKGTKIILSETFENDYEVEGAIIEAIHTHFEINRHFPKVAIPFADIEITINPIEEEK